MVGGIEIFFGWCNFQIEILRKICEETCFGDLISDDGFISGTDFSNELIYAEDIKSGEKILLFDGCKHGYNAMFCDIFSDEQIENRPASNYYKDKHGNEVFEIIISTYNDIDYEDEFREDVDENGLIELVNGTKTEFEKVKRNGYDTLQIWAKNEKGETIDFVSEELA